MRYRIFSSCVMHKKNYVHLILQIRSKANDVIKIAWTLSGFNFSAIGSLWRPLEAVLQPRHSDSVASPAKPRPLEAFKSQRWLKNWSSNYFDQNISFIPNLKDEVNIMKNSAENSTLNNSQFSIQYQLKVLYIKYHMGSKFSKKSCQIDTFL